MSKLKAAIIGLGRMGAEPSDRLGNLSNGWKPISHAESIKSIEAYELAAICDIDPGKVEKFSGIYHVPQGFNDYKALIDTIKPDVISIATRTNLKEEIIDYAIANSIKGIYVEKPLANSIEQCENILNRVKQAGIKFIYGTQRRGMDVFRKAKEMAHSGTLGNINAINFEYGSNMLLWTMPHLTDLVTLLTNSTRFKQISALCKIPAEYTIDSPLIDADPVVNSAVVVMDNGIQVVFSPGSGANIRIHLEKGIITVNADGYSIDSLTEGEFKGKFNILNRVLTQPSKSGTQELFIDLAESILQEKSLSRVTNEEILGGTEILFGMVESGLRNGAMVNYEDVRRSLVITGRFGELYA